MATGNALLILGNSKRRRKKREKYARARSVAVAVRALDELKGAAIMTKTDELRAMASALGIRYTCGLVCGDHRVNEDSVTTLYRQVGGPSRSVTFEEDADGALWVADEVSPRQAVALAMVDDGASA